MMNLGHLAMRILFAAGIGSVALLSSGDFRPGGPTQLISSAEARVGRPLTPVSYAGVARRTTRRTVAYGTAAGAAAAASCYQVVNAYGQLTTVCR